ncbi:MAG: Tat pathway signal sequence domain protein [Hyphomonadaceae bacterium]
MKLPIAALLALSVLPAAACSGSREGRTVELPGGMSSEPAAPEERSWLDRMVGRDDRPNAGPCPLMGVLYESSRLVQFAQPGDERYANIAYTGEVRGVRGLCRYVDADPIAMEVEIDMAFGRGPAATSDRQTYRYWVAVTRRGRAPIEKQYFDVEVRFDRNNPVATRTEEIGRIVIPRATPETSGDNFEILVGFELTPDQLAFNRDGKRFRIDAAAPQQGS